MEHVVPSLYTLCLVLTFKISYLLPYELIQSDHLQMLCSMCLHHLEYRMIVKGGRLFLGLIQMQFITSVDGLA